jgi:hypothetical protein
MEFWNTGILEFWGLVILDFGQWEKFVADQEVPYEIKKLLLQDQHSIIPRFHYSIGGVKDLTP